MDRISQNEFEQYAPEFIIQKSRSLEDRLVYPLGACLKFACDNYGQDFYETRTLPLVIRLVQYFEGEGLPVGGEYDDFLNAIFAASALIHATEQNTARSFSSLTDQVDDVVLDYARGAMRPRIKPSKCMRQAIRHVCMLKKSVFGSRLIAVGDRLVEFPHAMRQEYAQQYLEASKLYVPLLSCPIVDGVCEPNDLAIELSACIEDESQSMQYSDWA